MAKKRTAKKTAHQLDKSTFLVLACVVIALLVIFGSQTGTLPKLF
jgi:hypothetical protein